ncbi:unnamed protein product [Cuscuta campestris]|uniref:Uncharacterized protein n=1 Tax=Cuscuta campestris TaxID=132261 RepID=A0A484LRK1_9ASTE|nr:unnamed protein product [Cuscuta campestris]
MAEKKDAHVVVEIPVEGENQQKTSCLTAIQHHPLMEISRSPGHLLLLKLWQREEGIFGRKIAAKEARIDFLRREIFQICCSFFVFSAICFTVLSTAYSDEGKSPGACRKGWIPSGALTCTSLFVACVVHVKICRFWKTCGQLQRLRSDGRCVARCVQELRMKGESFDLSKEPVFAGKKMKSSSVEIRKWKTPLTWCSHYAVTILLVCFSGLLFTAAEFMRSC